MCAGAEGSGHRPTGVTSRQRLASYLGGGAASWEAPEVLNPGARERLPWAPSKSGHKYAVQP